MSKRGCRSLIVASVVSIVFWAVVVTAVLRMIR